MKADWLAATHFERMHEVISAINTLSIHAKLALAGITDPTPSAEVEKARSGLADFVESLEHSIERLTPDMEGTYVGSDTWLRAVALQFLAGDARDERRSRRSTHSLTAMADLVRSVRPEDLERLIADLQELRFVIEEQSQEDVDGILGDASW